MLKGIVCREMGGACDELIKGETATEIVLRAGLHYYEVGDDAHKEAMARIKAKSPEETRLWRRDTFEEMYAAAPEILEETE